MSADRRRRTASIGSALAAVAAGAVAFAPAFDPADLARAVVAGMLVGAVCAAITTSLRHRAPLVASPILVVAVGGSTVLLAAVSTAQVVAARDIPGILATYLHVGLPARGLPELALVPALCTFVATVVTLLAVAGRGGVSMMIGPTALLGSATLLVAPRSVPTAHLVVFLLAAAGALAARGSAATPVRTLEPLVPGAEGVAPRRRWRAGLQAALVACTVLLVATVAPLTPRTVRGSLEPPTETIDDPNPLAVAANWRRTDDATPLATVVVDGPVLTGRLRLAVLDDWTPTGWVQSARFARTGATLAPDPVFADLPATGPRGTVSVTRADGSAPFRAVPTPVGAVAVDHPRDRRAAPGAGVVVDTTEGTTVFRTVAVDRLASSTPTTPAARVPARLRRCASPAVAQVADALSTGAPDAQIVLDRIEDWLLTRRLFDPDAPGGQTAGSVDAFVSTPQARGDLEVFVTAHALLTRCAGIPSRVVIGLPAATSGTTEYSRAEIAAWVEVPIDGEGWRAIDPLPSPEDLARIAQLIASEPPSAADASPESPAAHRPTEVAALAVSRDTSTWIGVLGALALVLGLVGAASGSLPAVVARRRRRTADPTLATVAAWATVAEALHDRGLPVTRAHTPSEVAATVAPTIPGSVHHDLDALGRLADRARYGGDVGADDAAEAWTMVDRLLPGLRRSTGAGRVVASLVWWGRGLRRPRRWLRRLRSGSDEWTRDGAGRIGPLRR